MASDNLLIIEGFIKKRENGVVENYQIIVSAEAIYLVNASMNYGDYIKSLFTGVGEVIGFFGDTIGFVGELASEMTGDKVSKFLKGISGKAADKYMGKIIANLDNEAAKKKNVLKIEFIELEWITVKKGYLITGKSFVEFVGHKQRFKLSTKTRAKITELLDAFNAQLLPIEIKTAYF